MFNKTESFIYFEIFLQILLKRTTQALFLPILIPFAIFSVLIMVVIFTVLSFISQLKKRTHKNPNCII